MAVNVMTLVAAVLSAANGAAPKPSYIPEPKPVKTSILVGAHHCPLWEADKPHMWANVRKHPERTPALLRAGCHGVAAISSLYGAEDPAAMVREFLILLGEEGRISP